MACKFCIGKQQALVRMLCKRPDSRLCKKAQERLARMLEPEKPK